MKFMLYIWHRLMDIKMFFGRMVGTGALSFETKAGHLIVSVIFDGTEKHVRIATAKLPKAIEWIRAQPYGHSVVFRGGEDAWIYVPDYLTPRLREFLEDANAAFARGSKSDFGVGDVPAVNTKSSGPRAQN